MQRRLIETLAVISLSLAAACHTNARASTVVVRHRDDTCTATPAALRAQRERAVQRGLAFMANYLAPDERLHAMGSDAALLFLEFALTSASPTLRAQADPIARRNAVRLLPRYLAPGGLQASWDFANALELLVDAPRLGIPSDALQHVLLERFQTFARDDDAYGVSLTTASSLNDAATFDLLLMAYAFERANVVWPGRFPVHFGLEQALQLVWQRPLATWAASGPAADRATESAYLATHIALVLTEYGRHPLPPTSMGRFGAFLRAEFPAYLRVRDVEIVAETADVLRQLGETEASSAQLCAATQLLLSSQNADGSWGAWQRVSDPYDAVHKTWAAVTGLLDRMHGDDGPYGRRVTQILERVDSSRGATRASVTNQ